MISEVYIYSDGWANPNPGPGAFWVVMSYKWIEKEFSQAYEQTTNNRMELRWIIFWLSQLKKTSKVIICTDSRYVINGIEKWWAIKWKKNNWMKSWNTKAINSDLREMLLKLVEKHDVSFQWVKWHTWHTQNERCDELATISMENHTRIDDEWYILEDKNKNIKKSISSSKQTWEKIWDICKKCWSQLEKKIPKHTKKTLQKAYYYAFYHHCSNCKTNYMLEEAKRDIKTLKL